MRISTADSDSQASIARIAFLEETVAAQNAKLTALFATLAALNSTLAARDATVAALTEQLAKLSELLGRNSRNSHLPPSSDGPGSGAGGAAASKLRKKSERKRGGQKGHRGSYRALVSAAHVDTFVELFPDTCDGCADALCRTPDVSASRHQQLELRNHRPHVTEWRRHAVKCPRCGEVTRAPYDRKQLPASAFGPCLTAAVVILTGVYHLSRRKTQSLLKEFLGISVSLGAIIAMEHCTSGALKECHAEALREVQFAGVKHTDATSWLRAGKLMSLWVLASTLATVYSIFDDGKRATIRPLFGPMRGILVSDRATVFTFWTMARRQICHAHLLRKFVAFSERNGLAGVIGRELLQYISLIFEYWHGFKNGLLTREEFAFWMRPVQRAVEQLLERGEQAGIRGLSGSCADILAHRDALWTFVTHENVEPTNNHAERELRDVVLWRKCCFGTQSERGERFAERVMTAVRTLRKQGKAVLDFVTRSITAHIAKTPAPKLIGA